MNRGLVVVADVVLDSPHPGFLPDVPLGFHPGSVRLVAAMVGSGSVDEFGFFVAEPEHADRAVAGRLRVRPP